MTGRLHLLVLLAVAGLVVAGLAGGVSAQMIRSDRAGATGATYDLSWWTVDGGGQTFSTGGDYTLSGTGGQPDAGVLEGNGYTLTGGFWGGAAAQYNVYLPLVVRNY